VIAMATVPLKEFTAVARTLTFEPDVPATRVRDVGDTVRENSGGGGAAEMVSAMLTVWPVLPAVPLTVTVALPGVAINEAVSTTFCAMPGVNESVDGLAVTPEGSPLMVTSTVPVKLMT